jgi:hypothetical protein
VGSGLIVGAVVGSGRAVGDGIDRGARVVMGFTVGAGWIVGIWLAGARSGEGDDCGVPTGPIDDTGAGLPEILTEALTTESRSG